MEFDEEVRVNGESRWLRINYRPLNLRTSHTYCA